jgi:hypothetical protein
VVPRALSLGLRQTRYRDYAEPLVRWIDPSGEPLPTAMERADQERARADRERARAEAALARVRELEKVAGQSKARQ